MARQKKSAPAEDGNGGSLKDLLRELWEAAVRLRGSIEPADYKRYVLPIIILRFLSLRYDRRRAELERLIADPTSDYHTTDPKAVARILADPDEYQAGRGVRRPGAGPVGQRRHRRPPRPHHGAARQLPRTARNHLP